jgi:hypothetical protein
MKKFISAVTALAMTATMASVAPAVVNASDASKTLTIKAFDKPAEGVTFKDVNNEEYTIDSSAYTVSGDTITVSKDAAAKGRVAIPLALYLSEDTFDTETISAPITVNSSSSDIAKVAFGAHSPADSYYAEDKSYDAASVGKTVKTNKFMSYSTSVNKLGKLAVAGTPSINLDTSQEPFGTKNAYFGFGMLYAQGYTTTNDWVGGNSEDYPLVTFDLVLPKNAEGTYTVDFCKDAIQGANPACAITAQGEKTYAAATGFSGLELNTIKVKVGDDTEPSSSEDVTTSSSTTSEAVTTSSDVVSSEDVNLDGDIVIIGEDVTADPGEEVPVTFVLQKHNNNTVASLDFTYKCDAGLEMTYMDEECAAYGASFLNNEATWEQSCATLDSAQDPMLGKEGEVIATVMVKAPSADGVYEINIDPCKIYKKGSSSALWTAAIKPATVTVGNPVTTSSAESTSTSTTSEAVTTSSDTVSSEDVNLDGDIVIIGEEVEVDPDTEDIPVTFVLQKHNNNTVASLDFTYKCDNGLVMTYMDEECAAYGASFLNNEATWEQSCATLDSAQDPMLGKEGEVIATVMVNAPKEPGRYEINIDPCKIFKKGSSSALWTASIKPAVVVVKGEETESTESTQTTSSTTTEDITTSSSTTSEDVTGDLTPDFGDVNVDGEVNIADVVVLNKWLNNHDDYNLTPQGQVNADCFEYNKGQVLTAKDSDAIIKHIIHLPDYLTLPVE